VFTNPAVVLRAQVERLQGVVRDRRANWAQSVATLRAAKALGARVTKTSLMLGCGEAPGEVVAALEQLRDAGAHNGHSPLGFLSRVFKAPGEVVAALEQLRDAGARRVFCQGFGPNAKESNVLCTACCVWLVIRCSSCVQSFVMPDEPTSLPESCPPAPT
jgi:hypothetical protein